MTESQAAMKVPTPGLSSEIVSTPGVYGEMFRGGVEEGRYKATWNREFKLPWRKAGPLRSSR